MDGYLLLANSYKKILEEHSEFNEDERADIVRNIKNLERLVGTCDQDRNDIFNSGAFNDICRGYIREAMRNCGLNDKIILLVIDEFNYLLDTMPACVARTK